MSALDLAKMRVVDLKQELSQRRLSTSGRKASLLNRLREALELEKTPGASAEAIVDAEEAEAQATGTVETELELESPAASVSETAEATATAEADESVTEAMTEDSDSVTPVAAETTAEESSAVPAAMDDDTNAESAVPLDDAADPVAVTDIATTATASEVELTSSSSSASHAWKTTVVSSKQKSVKKITLSKKPNPLYCKSCEQLLNSEAQMDTHLLGKKHLRKAEAVTTSVAANTSTSTSNCVSGESEGKKQKLLVVVKKNKKRARMNGIGANGKGENTKKAIKLNGGGRSVVVHPAPRKPPPASRSAVKVVNGVTPLWKLHNYATKYALGKFTWAFQQTPGTKPHDAEFAATLTIDAGDGPRVFKAVGRSKQKAKQAVAVSAMQFYT